MLSAKQPASLVGELEHVSIQVQPIVALQEERSPIAVQLGWQVVS
jgi:hypothetical protein